MGEKPDNASDKRELINRFLNSGAPLGTPPVSIKGPIFIGEFSTVFYAESALAPYPLAIKFCTSQQTGLPNPADAVEQYQALKTLAAQMPISAPYGVPIPFKLDQENALIASEWINGETLTALLKDVQTPRSQLATLIERAGIWLRRFHLAALDAPGKLDTAEKFREFAQGLKDSRLHSDRIFERAYREIERNLSTIAQLEFPRALLHGDFKTDNLMLSGERMVGLDFQSRHRNFVLWDICAFLNRLGLFLYSPHGIRLLKSRAELERRFLSGYFERELSVQESAAIAWLRLLILLNQWDDRHIAMQGQWLKRLANDWAYRREANYLRKTLENI